jgi:hypothetical protein
VLDDPLQDNSQGNNWEVYDSSAGRACNFTNRALDISTNQLAPALCPAMSTDFTDFIYEIQMKIVKGGEGGIAFRISTRSGGGYPNYYEFVIDQYGSYSVEAYPLDISAVFAQGFSPAIHRGLNQTNLVAAVVHGKIIELYVNHQRVAVVDSGTYTPLLTHGRIGVAIDIDSFQTEVIFQNAKVWKL